MADTGNAKLTLKERLALKKRSRTLKRRARKAEGATVRHARRFVVNRWDKISEVRLHIIGWLAGVGLLIGIVGLQMIWFQQSYITDAPVSGGTYAEALRGPVQTLNPLYATSPAELAAGQLVFSSLYQYDTTGHLRGDVATRLQNKEDKEFTVSLRRDVRWHDGEPMTAKDIVFTVELMKNPAARSVMTASWQDIGVEAVDDYTVRFLLPSAYGVFPEALTFAILPAHLLESVDPASMRENSFSSKPVGSGPFRLQLFQTVNQVTDRKIVHLNANEDYYAGRPRLDRLQLHAYKDEEAISQALRTGEVTGASDVSSTIASVLDSDRYTVVVRPVNSGVYALLNVSHPILKDPTVRRALLMATDTAAIREQLQSNPQPLYLPFVEGQVAGADAIAPPQTDRAAAARLLDSEGWELRDGVRMKGNETLRLRIVTRKDGDYEKVLQRLAGQWRELGVQVETEVFDTSDVNKSFTRDILQTRNYDVVVDELVIGGDPDVFAFWHSEGLLNFSGYSDDISDDALSSARAISDPALRAAKYTAFARQWLADVPAIGLYQSNYFYVHTKATQAVDLTQKIVNPNEHYADVRYWTAERGRVYKTP